MVDIESDDPRKAVIFNFSSSTPAAEIRARPRTQAAVLRLSRDKVRGGVRRLWWNTRQLSTAHYNEHFSEHKRGEIPLVKLQSESEWGEELLFIFWTKLNAAHHLQRGEEVCQHRSGLKTEDVKNAALVWLGTEGAQTRAQLWQWKCWHVTQPQSVSASILIF